MNKTLNGNEDNLALYYSFDQVTSGEIEDQAGLNNGTMVNNPGIFNSDAIQTPVLKDVSNVGIDHFTIKWNPVPNAKEYYIDVATDPDFNNLVKYGIPTNGNTTYTVKGLSKGTVYYYKVTAQNNNDDKGSQYGHIATKLNPPGNALAFDGVDGEVNVEHVMDSDWNQITLEAWAKIAPDQNAAYPRILENYGSDAGFSLNLWRETRELYFEFRDATDNSWDTIMAPKPINDNLWHHIACTYDGTDMKIFLDGELISTKDNPGAVINKQIVKTGIGNQNGVAPLNGTLDEIRIWNVARTAAELKEYAHKTLRGSESGLFSYFNLDKAEGNTFKDEAGNSDGTMTDGDDVMEMITLDNLTGIESIHQANIQVYPNPAVDQLYINAKNVKSVELINQKGRLIMKKEGNINNLNVSEYETGIYILNIRINGKIHTTRVLIQ